MANEEDPMLEPLDGWQMHDPKRQQAKDDKLWK
jgi:hypothetical protein